LVPHHPERLATEGGIAPLRRDEIPVPRWTFTVGPGVVQLRREARGVEWEGRDEFDDGYEHQLSIAGSTWWGLNEPVTAGCQGSAAIEDLPSEGEPGKWTGKSRAYMTRTLALLDWSPIITSACGRPAMVTLTYPGDWRACLDKRDRSGQQIPMGRVVKRHLGAFFKAWERTIGPAACVWKLEFQARGAPHVHLYLMCPDQVMWSRGRGRGATATAITVREFVLLTWARIVGAQGEDRAKHERAGTAVDFAEGAKYTDPKRLAVYFTRHTAKGSKSKAYQHQAPDDFGKVGRWWGYRHLEHCTSTVQLDESLVVDTRRFLRALERARYQRTVVDVKGNRPVYEMRPAARPLRVRRVNRTTGEIRRRSVNRRRVTKSLYGSAGGFLLVNDGPEVTAALAVFLHQLQRDRFGCDRPLERRGGGEPRNECAIVESGAEQFGEAVDGQGL
jgi:hypothetical protein